MLDSNLKRQLALWYSFALEIPLAHDSLKELLGTFPFFEFSDESLLIEWLERFGDSWQDWVGQAADGLMRSPLHETSRQLPDGGAAYFTYERCFEPSFLEARFEDSQTDWYQGKTIVTRGRGAPLFCLLQALENLYLPSPEKPLRFATRSLSESFLKLLQHRAHGSVRHRHAGKDSAFFRSIRSGSCDALIVPVLSEDNSWALAVDEFVLAMKQRQKERLIFLVLDLSSVGENFVVEDFLQRLGPDGPYFVFAFESCLDHLQMGLGLVEVGRIRVWERRGGQDALGAVIKLLRLVRSHCGLGLTFREASELLLPSVENSRYRKDHCREVATSNRVAADALADTFDLDYQIGSLHLFLKGVEESAFLDQIGDSAFRPGVLPCSNGLKVSFPPFRGSEFHELLRRIKAFGTKSSPEMTLAP